ncbi:hypothetical protein A9K55_001480 [Cordyceps militaris]|uniref:Uncharacterized protein n=1 Tax=Cordyceps militaris TaxID=73501 RepID=A0A2H4SSV6_CORMI|nr:hypothetical protein A9K55_001480 [Cordyceps militaris]
MPYLSRRTVRGLLARSRTRHSSSCQESLPAPCTASVPGKIESPGAPTISACAPAGVAAAASLTSSTHAVTAREGSSSSSSSSPPPVSLAPLGSQTTGEQQTHSSESTQPSSTAIAYLEAGIPITGTDAAPPPVFAPLVSGHVATTDSPPYEFNGLFAVPASSYNPPMTSSAPPLYQPRAAEDEVFPQLAFTPFHRNALAARSGEQVEHELPGDDRFPSFAGSRVVNGSWLSGRFEPFTVGGRTFFCPVDLLLRYPHWQLLLSLERPAHGWVLSTTIDPAIFALVLEALISPAGFDGTEPGLSLVKLALAARQAHDWGMDREVFKLVASVRRFVARRVLYRNPHRPDAQGVMDHHYFVHRSEDIVRAWRVARRAPPALQACLAPAELVQLYALAVPRDLWPALTAEFCDEFAAQIDLAARLRVVPEEVDYHDWWLRWFRLAGCLDYDWIADVPDVLNLFFRSQEEAAQANADQERIVQATEGAAVDGMPAAPRDATAAAEGP